MFLVLSTVLVAAGCSSSGTDAPKEAVAGTPYFSIETYFQAEAQRLQDQSPLVHKTVMKNEETEERELTIGNWANELELFVISDINMDAWIGKYEVDSVANRVTYQALDPTLRTRRIAIHRSDDGSIRHIQVANETSNMLYTSKELLDYFPDSLYRIEKHQDIRWWSDNTYKIVGRISAD